MTTKEEKEKTEIIEVFTNEIQTINEAFKNIGLEQLQFNLKEEQEYISAIFVPSNGSRNYSVAYLDDIFDKNQDDVLAWLNNQFNNRYLYKALHQHFKDYFGGVYIEQPTKFSLELDDITYFISQYVTDEQKVAATIEGVISQEKERKKIKVQLKNNILVCVSADNCKELDIKLSKKIQSPFETLGENMDILKLELESRAESILHDKEKEMQYLNLNEN